eukprot:1612201-Rhodomonas_salina.1
MEALSLRKEQWTRIWSRESKRTRHCSAVTGLDLRIRSVGTGGGAAMRKREASAGQCSQDHVQRARELRKGS